MRHLAINLYSIIIKHKLLDNSMGFGESYGFLGVFLKNGENPLLVIKIQTNR